MKNICNSCKKEFIADVNRKVFCNTCILEKKHLADKEYRKKNAEKIRIKDREHARKQWELIKSDPIKLEAYRLKKREQQKRLYAKDPDKYKNRKRNQNLEVTIGKHILDLSLEQPTYGTKQLWSGIGRWSKDFECCVECNKTIYKHAAGGVCRNCYEKLKYIPEYQKEHKRFLKIEKKEVYAERRKSRREQAKEFLKKAEKGEIPLTPKINNLLSNL